MCLPKTDRWPTHVWATALVTIIIIDGLKSIWCRVGVPKLFSRCQEKYTTSYINIILLYH